MQKWPVTESAEVVPATLNFVYGATDAAFLSNLRKDRRVSRVGSALLDGLASDEPRQGRFLYVLFHNPGNLTQAECEFAHPETDHAWLFARHRRVIDLAAKHPGITLVIRPHPAHFTWCLYEPLNEYAAERGIRNIRIDRSTFDPNVYYAGYEGVIMDYPSTGLLQALAKGRKVACHVGKPYRVAPDGEAALRRAADCADDDEAFFALVERWFSAGAGRPDPAAVRDYLLLCGKAATPSLPAAARALDEIMVKWPES